MGIPLKVYWDGVDFGVVSENLVDNSLHGYPPTGCTGMGWILGWFLKIWLSTLFMGIPLRVYWDGVDFGVVFKILSDNSLHGYPPIDWNLKIWLSNLFMGIPPYIGFLNSG
jgi:hypothetical protein